MSHTLDLLEFANITRGVIAAGAVDAKEGYFKWTQFDSPRFIISGNRLDDTQGSRDAKTNNSWAF